MRKSRAGKRSLARTSSHPESIERSEAGERHPIDERILRLRELTLSIKEMLHL
jgi:hypothetical protein